MRGLLSWHAESRPLLTSSSSERVAAETSALWRGACGSARPKPENASLLSAPPRHERTSAGRSWRRVRGARGVEVTGQ